MNTERNDLLKPAVHKKTIDGLAVFARELSPAKYVGFINAQQDSDASNRAMAGAVYLIVHSICDSDGNLVFSPDDSVNIPDMMPMSRVRSLSNFCLDINGLSDRGKEEIAGNS